MKKIFFLIYVLFLFNNTWSASFDCNGNNNTMLEITVCKTPLLSQLDDELHVLFSPYKDNRLFIDIEVDWLVSKRNECIPELEYEECIKNAYIKQISFFNDLKKESLDDFPIADSTYEIIDESYKWQSYYLLNLLMPEEMRNSIDHQILAANYYDDRIIAIIYTIEKYDAEIMPDTDAILPWTGSLYFFDSKENILKPIIKNKQINFVNKDLFYLFYSKYHKEKSAIYKNFYADEEPQYQLEKNNFRFQVFADDTGKTVNYLYSFKDNSLKKVTQSTNITSSINTKKLYNLSAKIRAGIKSYTPYTTSWNQIFIDYASNRTGYIIKEHILDLTFLKNGSFLKGAWSNSLPYYYSLISFYDEGSDKYYINIYKINPFAKTVTILSTFNKYITSVYPITLGKKEAALYIEYNKLHLLIKD